MRPEDRIDCSQFGIDDDGKTLYWTPDDENISISATRGDFRFLALSTLATRYKECGTNAPRISLGLTGYRSRISRLGKKAVETLQNAEETLPKNIESIKLKDLSGATNDVIGTTGDVETALKTIDDPQMDVAWATQAARELAGVSEAMTRMRDGLANNLAKLSDDDDRKSKVERHLARERRKLTETDDTEIQQDIRDRMKKLQGEPSDLELERQARLEALSTNKAALRSQIRETIRRLLHEDTTLAERIRTLFREHPHSNRHGDLDTRACRWGKCASAVADSQATRQGRGQGVGKKAPTGPWACPGQFGRQGRCGPARHHRVNSLLASGCAWKTATWLADNLWALVISVGALLLVAARDWLARPQLKRH